MTLTDAPFLVFVVSFTVLHFDCLHPLCSGTFFAIFAIDIICTVVFLLILQLVLVSPYEWPLISFVCQTCPVLDKRELFFTFYIVARKKILYLVGLAITHILQFLPLNSWSNAHSTETVYGSHCKANWVLCTVRQLLSPNQCHLKRLLIYRRHVQLMCNNCD